MPEETKRIRNEFHSTLFIVIVEFISLFPGSIYSLNKFETIPSGTVLNSDVTMIQASITAMSFSSAFWFFSILLTCSTYYLRYTYDPPLSSEDKKELKNLNKELKDTRFIVVIKKILATQSNT